MKEVHIVPLAFQRRGEVEETVLTPSPRLTLGDGGRASQGLTLRPPLCRTLFTHGSQHEASR